MKFYTGVTKGLKLKVRKLGRLIPTFVEVTGEKLVGGVFPPILNRVKICLTVLIYFLTKDYNILNEIEYNSSSQVEWSVPSNLYKYDLRPN